MGIIIIRAHKRSTTKVFKKGATAFAAADFRTQTSEHSK
jgi:hypothetical protein